MLGPGLRMKKKMRVPPWARIGVSSIQRVNRLKSIKKNGIFTGATAKITTTLYSCMLSGIVNTFEP